jgi:hypothetical protein
MKISAITRKNQAQVNKAVKYLVKYNELNDLRNIADANANEKEYNKYERQCGKAFDNYLEAICDLPKREIAQIEKVLY